jgi:hypothetical protein
MGATATTHLWLSIEMLNTAKPPPLVNLRRVMLALGASQCTAVPLTVAYADTLFFAAALGAP